MEMEGQRILNPQTEVCVYIVQCADGTLYTGWTNNMEKRMKCHNDGKGAKYTRARRPVVLVYLEYAENAVAAQRREREIKRLSRAKKLLLINQ